MQDDLFIVCEPLLNVQERLLGYELAWHQPRPQADDKLALAKAIVAHAGQTASGGLSSKHTLFLELSPALLADEILAELPAKSTVLALQAADITDGVALTAVKLARQRGFGISVRGLNFASLSRDMLASATHAEIPADSADFASRVKALRDLGLSGLQPVARQVSSWEAFDLCAKLGVHAFVGNLHLTKRTSGTRARELNPSQTLILQLMDMVRRNSDVRELEGVLKRDAALAYKLLRYINSAGFGLGCEVQSLRHAVTMLGYSPLYRWLSLLLATATTTGFSPVLLQAAVVRARFSELLGQHFLPKSEAENLFVAGMFSLLDKLLGVPMEDVLEKVPLSESITQALLAREGIYGPFLALAESCELNSPETEMMATSLCISTEQVNQAHLSALLWAQSIEI